MSYYSVIGLEREPFSTSPDPDFLFLSREHKAALCRLQIAISLKRGLSVVLGDVGMGKTTLSRKLSQTLGATEDVCFHMILNPLFKSEKQFLTRLSEAFHIDVSSRSTGLDHIEAIERFLFRRGVEEGKTIVLLIDEAQIIPKFVLEILRILLNYETNEYKILQLVLVGQLELLPTIREMPNFWDRIALRYVLNPLGEEEVEELIDFRLRQAGYKGQQPLFTPDAVKLIWDHTRGYPRRLTMCCHNAMESLVMFDRSVVDGDLARRVIEEERYSSTVPASHPAVRAAGAHAEELLARDVSVPALKVRYGGGVT